jgi:peptidyl-prolyl cis-trans isomerase C
MKKLLKTTIISAIFLVSTAIFAQNAAIVNGKSIPKSKLDRLIVKSGQPPSPEVREKGRELLITRELVLQEAEKRGINQREDIKDQIEQAKLGILVAAVFEDFIAKDGISDAELQGAYETVKGQFAGKEYKVKHILVEKEADAKSLIAKIKAGASFEELAKANSKDPGSATKGGELDWVSSTALVPEFSKAMSALNKGQMTQTPVKTQFGWHIILLEDVRDVKVPTIQELKPQLVQMLTQDENWQRAKFSEMMQKFKSKAKIE